MSQIMSSSEWTKFILVNAGDLQDSNLGPLLFLIYINDVLNGASSNCKLFADDASFSVVNDIQSSAAILRNDLTVISNWAFQWKMIFNTDLTKQAQEVIFSKKLRNWFTLVFCFKKLHYKIVYLKNISGWIKTLS